MTFFRVVLWKKKNYSTAIGKKSLFKPENPGKKKARQHASERIASASLRQRKRKKKRGELPLTKGGKEETPPVPPDSILKKKERAGQSLLGEKKRKKKNKTCAYILQKGGKTVPAC